MGIRSLFKKKHAFARVAVLGLDGVPCGLLRDLVARGVMPAMAGLFKQGSICEMQSSMPPVSSVAWTSFMTGCNPAKHGIFGFMDRRRESYGIYFPNSLQIKTPTIWDILSAAERTTVAVNIPQTYPARELNGIMISGFVALDLEKAVYPHKLVSALRQIDYRIDVDYQNADQRAEEFFNDLFYTLKKRRETLLYLLDKITWHVFIGVFTGTDRLQHYFWDAIENPLSPWHGRILEYYRALDNVIAEIAGRLADDSALLLLSDHGFGRLEKEVYINTWFKEQGLLQLACDPPKSFDDITPQGTKVFALDPGRVYVNLKGLMPQGIVNPGLEYERLLDSLTGDFLELRDEQTGDKVISRVWRRKELYSGPFFEKAPDLVLSGARGYDLKGALSKKELLGKGKFTGMHTPDDAFLYIKGIPPLKQKPAIQDIAPTVLDLLGMPVPPDMDGRSLI